MIQPVKKLRILSLTVKGFKGFSEETAFTFGDLNTITGHNGQGKSSIADAIAFAITGVSFYGGSKLDHLYHKNTRDISVVMEFSDEGCLVHRLSRSCVNDNMDIFLDERRMTQRDLTIMFGERDLFLSMLNPRYFIDILGAKGRDLLERYLPDIPKETILAGLSEHNQALLEGQDFLSAEAFAQKLREEIAQLKRDTIYTQGQYDLQVSQAEENAAQLEQKQAQYDSLTAEAAELEARRTTGFDGTSLREKLPDLYARHEELLREQPAGPELTAEVDAQIQAAAQTLEQLRAKAYQSKYTQALADTQARIDTLKKEVSRQKYIVTGLKPGVQCPMCKQTVTEATLPKVKQEFQTSVDSLSRQGKEQMDVRDGHHHIGGACHLLLVGVSSKGQDTGPSGL
ncbi:MAG: AAA family ATPase, partial [Lawsonibacter sp.]|nr:AAA family ATPase [Lawsonibacter sp.]